MADCYFFDSKGLGKDGSGIVEPVEAVVLPQGKNILYLLVNICGL